MDGRCVACGGEVAGEPSRCPRLGAAFDLRAFHAKLLSGGPIPPRLIEEEWRAESE